VILFQRGAQGSHKRIISIIACFSYAQSINTLFIPHINNKHSKKKEANTASLITEICNALPHARQRKEKQNGFSIMRQ
jgi:mannitol/fructose-specific phosphotransferase system IIA component (Ntr-type)